MKRTRIAMLILLGSLSLCACGSTKENKAADETQNSAETENSTIEDNKKDVSEEDTEDKTEKEEAASQGIQDKYEYTVYEWSDISNEGEEIYVNLPEGYLYNCERRHGNGWSAYYYEEMIRIRPASENEMAAFDNLRKTGEWEEDDSWKMQMENSQTVETEVGDIEVVSGTEFYVHEDFITGEEITEEYEHFDICLLNYEGIDWRVYRYWPIGENAKEPIDKVLKDMFAAKEHVKAKEENITYQEAEVSADKYDYLLQVPNYGYAADEPHIKNILGFNEPEGYTGAGIDGFAGCSGTEFEGETLYDAFRLSGKDNERLCVFVIGGTYLEDYAKTNILPEGVMYGVDISELEFYVDSVEKKEVVNTPYGETTIFYQKLKYSKTGAVYEAEAALFYVNGKKVMITYMADQKDEASMGYSGTLVKLFEEMF